MSVSCIAFKKRFGLSLNRVNGTVSDARAPCGVELCAGRSARARAKTGRMPWWTVLLSSALSKYHCLHAAYCLVPMSVRNWPCAQLAGPHWVCHVIYSQRVVPMCQCLGVLGSRTMVSVHGPLFSSTVSGSGPWMVTTVTTLSPGTCASLWGD